ncbi:MAG: hypothetical protein OXF79_10955 [Chloroflexi bacterium]|nr:hypothetical protein [Chloroflexota bacterium]
MTRTVQEEVADFLDDFFSQRHPGTSARNVAMVLYLYGFGGATEPTLEAAAERFEIGKIGRPDRERVRQILDDTKDALCGAELSSIDGFVDLVSEAPSWLSSELATSLVERGLVDEPFSISGLLRLAIDSGAAVDYTIRPPDLSGTEKHRKRKGGADWVARVEEKYEAFLILNRERVSHAKRLLKHARRIKKYGLARVDHVLDAPECSDIPERHRLLEQLLQASEDAWVGSEGGSTWYLFEDQQHVFKNVADKVFSVTDACDPSHLAEACLRYLVGRSYPQPPAPPSLIRRYFETSTAFEAVCGQVRYPFASSVSLGAVDEDLVACLKASPEGATGADVAAYLKARGHSRYSISGATGKSPLARRVGKREGLSGFTYFLIGTGSNGSSTVAAQTDHHRYVGFRERLARLPQTDGDTATKCRREQRILRRWLFEGKDEERCALCGRTYMIARRERRLGQFEPHSALHAAHKKKRTLCNPAERRDPHIVMALCLFGCDFVYENRHVVVRDGVAVRGDLEGCSEAVRKYVESLDGRKICDRWLAGKPWYFDHADRFST